MMARTQEPSPIAQFSHQVQYVINLLANRYQLPYEQTFDIHTKCLYAPLLEKSPEKLAHAFEAFLIEELLSRTEDTFMDNVAAQFFGKAAKEASPLTIYNLLNTSLFAGRSRT